MKRFMVLALIGLLSTSCGRMSSSVTPPATSAVVIPDSNDVGRPTLDQMVSIIDRAYAMNPDSNLANVQSDIWSAIKCIPPKPRLDQPMSVESYSLYQLNWQEMLLLASQPLNAAPTKKARDDAITETNRRWPQYSIQYQNKPDAFRHSYWNILMCKRISEEWARLFSTAHEYGAENGLLDAQMDLNNNGIGRAIWRTYGGRSEAGYSDLVMNWRYVKVNSFTNAVPYLIYLTGS